METKAIPTTRTAVFTDKESADAAYKAALQRGYRPDDIHIIMSDDTRKKYYGDTSIKTEVGDKSMEGLAMGGALGGTMLGVIGAIVALSSTIVVPGVGLVIAGPLAAGLVGAGAGSIAGGIVGALIGAGIPEERATIYEKDIKQGGILMTVRSSADRDAVLLEDWKKNNGRNIY